MGGKDTVIYPDLQEAKELDVPLGVKYGKPVDIAIGSTRIKAFNRGE
ncbi:MAG: hypothetical protein M1388_01740 [Thaumarchaeota archaeon]|nr:hypothetical protein [Nitrososphaerota archaeon]